MSQLGSAPGSALGGPPGARRATCANAAQTNASDTPAQAPGQRTAVCLMVRQRNARSSGRLRSVVAWVVAWVDAVLTQNGPQPAQLVVHPADIPGQRRAAISVLPPTLHPGVPGA